MLNTLSQKYFNCFHYKNELNCFAAKINVKLYDYQFGCFRNKQK